MINHTFQVADKQVRFSLHFPVSFISVFQFFQLQTQTNSTMTMTIRCINWWKRSNGCFANMISMWRPVCRKWFVQPSKMRPKMWQKATDQVQKKYSMDCQGECRAHISWERRLFNHKIRTRCLYKCKRWYHINTFRHQSSFVYSEFLLLLFFFLSPRRLCCRCSTWLLRRLTAGTAISDAILAGQRSADCEKKFFDCNLESKKLQQMFDLLLRTIN